MAETSGGMMSAAQRKLSLQPEERRIFGQLFKECDTDGTGVITGEAAVKLLQRTHVNEHVLGEIWGLADTENRGFLQQEDFAKALRLIGHYQTQPGRPLKYEMALSPAPLPKFEGLNMPPTTTGAPAPSFPPQAIAAQNSGSVRVPPLSPDRVADYTKLFDRAGAQNGFLSGDVARNSFEKSGLAGDVLAHVWNLADTEQRGALNVTEFIIAMHLLASYKARAISALPLSIPAGLFEAASKRPVIPPPPTRPAASAVPRQFSGSSAGKGPTGRQFTPPVGADDWVVGPREKVSYDELFDKVDTTRVGYVTGDQAVLFFSDSGLRAEVLAQIWDLANIRRVDQLNRDEFAVAMYLIRHQRGKAQPDLPSELPPNYVPPSLRGFPKSTAAAPYPGASQAPVLAQAPPKSNVEDLFGLDALTSAPSFPVQQQTTGGSGTFPARSQTSDPFGGKPASPTTTQNISVPRGTSAHFKSFVPQSSFGQALTSQSTGASGTSTSSPNIKQSAAMDDLLGDNDPEISKKLTGDTTELANMSNQIGTLRTQMQAVQSKKGATESELASTTTQKRDLELRLSQFRNQYEQEVKTLKGLEDQLSTVRKDVNGIQQQLSVVEGSLREVQTQRQESQASLDREQRQSTGLKERLRQLTTDNNAERAQVEKLNAELRHEKGMGSIYKKQVEKGEDELNRLRSESQSLSRGQEPARPQASREVTASSVVSQPASATSSTNPFFRRPSPQSSIDNTMSPSGFSRTTSQDTNKFDNIFGAAFASPQSTAPPNSTKLDLFSDQSGPSIRSSEPDVPTPSTSPPLSAYQESPQPPAPPASRQMTSRDLPLGEGQNNASAATSVRVETPVSRYDINTPTKQASSSPAVPPLDRTDTTRSNATSTGAAMFDRKVNTSSPVASNSSDAPKAKAPDHGDLFRSMSASKDMPGSFPPANDSSPLQPNVTGGSAFTDLSKDSGKKAESSSSPRGDTFTFPSQSRSTTGNKNDIDAAFASVGKPAARQATGSSANGSLGDPVAKFNTDFPPIKVKDEFPPIAVREEDSEESDSDHGFADDFTKASPKARTVKKDQLPDRSRPSTGPEESEPIFKPQSTLGSSSTATGASEFAGPLAGASPSAEKGVGSPAAGSQGAALFGTTASASKGTSAAPTSMFSTSPPDTNRTSNVPSDTYLSAVSHQSSTDKDFPTLEQSNAAFVDDFDVGFDDLVDAKDIDDRAEEDLMFGSHHHDDEFNTSFDSPSVSKSNTLADRTPTSKVGFATEDSFGDFESNFDRSVKHGTSSKSSNDWDTLMKSIDVDPRKGFDDSGTTFPEAPEPPKLGRAISTGTEHDDPILKRLTGMGYPRTLALDALEKYDYDIQKASEHLASPH